jgi:hypothetical protein
VRVTPPALLLRTSLLEFVPLIASINYTLDYCDYRLETVTIVQKSGCTHLLLGLLGIKQKKREEQEPPKRNVWRHLDQHNLRQTDVEMKRTRREVRSKCKRGEKRKLEMQ